MAHPPMGLLARRRVRAGVAWRHDSTCDQRCTSANCSHTVRIVSVASAGGETHTGVQEATTPTDGEPAGQQLSQCDCSGPVPLVVPVLRCWAGRKESPLSPVGFPRRPGSLTAGLVLLVALASLLVAS